MRKHIKTQKSASEMLDLYFLDMRSALLETASAFDRINRADGDVGNDKRMKQLKTAIDILADSDENKAARFLEVLSE